MLSVWTRQDQVAGYDGKVTHAPQTNQPAQAATVLSTDQLGPHPDLAKIVLHGMFGDGQNALGAFSAAESSSGSISNVNS